MEDRDPSSAFGSPVRRIAEENKDLIRKQLSGKEDLEIGRTSLNSSEEESIKVDPEYGFPMSGYDNEATVGEPESLFPVEGMDVPTESVESRPRSGRLPDGEGNLRQENPTVLSKEEHYMRTSNPKAVPEKENFATEPGTVAKSST